MRSFDQSLMKLVAHNYVTLEEAMAYSSNPDNFALKVKGIQSGVQSDWDENIETSTQLNTQWIKQGSQLEVDKKNRS